MKKKKLTSLILAMLLMVQTLVPGVAFATNNNNVEKTKQNLVKVGELDTKSYPKLDNKTILAIQKQAREKRKPQKRNRGAGLFSVDSPYLPGQHLTDNEKAIAYGKVNVDFKAVGLNDNGTTKDFQWREIFGEDSNGNPTNAKIHFIQRDAETKKELGRYTLFVNKAGEYKWTDTFGKEALLPLYSDKLEPYEYDAALDYEMTDKVKLLTIEIGTTNEKSSFKKDEQGRNVATIPLKLQLAQVASTRFSSEWKTSVEEKDRLNVEGLYNTKNKDEEGQNIENLIAFPKNNEDTIQLRNDKLKPGEGSNLPYDQSWASDFRNVPEVKVVEGLDYSEDEENGKSTYNIDEDNKIITTLDKKHKFKYDFTYDVINGGKLTMTEIIPVTFDANGGKFASITEEGKEQKIVKEVDYDGTLIERAETPKKPGKAFKGWATTQDGKPAADSEYANLKSAKTFYAIWSDEDIQVEELKTTESLGRFPKRGDPKFTNDFVPKFDELKAQVKVKDANGKIGPLPNGATFSIIDGTKEYTEQSDELKKFIYDKVKEKEDDKVSRTETVKAKITYSDGTTREIDIPIKVLKNIYKGTDEGNKYPHIPENYVRVTIDPTDKAQDKQKTYYYVNPKANVLVIPTDPVGKGDNKFSKWTMKKDSATGDGADYTTTAFNKKRYKFEEASTITAQYGTGIVKISYVDQDGNEIDKKYQTAGQDYPSDKSGALGKYANAMDYAEKGPDFKGYIYERKDPIKSQKYADPVTDTIKYYYNKRVTTKRPNNERPYFKVVFDANGGKFGADTQKYLWVYRNTGKNPVTFEEARAEIEIEYGLPTKEMAAFKEWRDKADAREKVDDAKEIKFPGWVSGSYTPEVFYAHYEQTSAKVVYLDLDGKPIADDFKIDGVEYPTEKEGKAGEAIAKDVFTEDNAPKFTGYKFNRIELNPKDGKYSLDKTTTIKIYYENVPDVIPANPDGSNPDSVPADYVRVEFVPTDKGTMDGDKVFFVNPKKEVTIPVNNPKAKATYKFNEWKIGANADGAVYTPNTPKKFTQDTTITATYGETENIIPYDPSVPDPMVRPEGYIRVTFAAEKGLELTEQKAYYVKKNAKDTDGKPLTLGNTELKKPGVKAETGYQVKLEENKQVWEPVDSTEIKEEDITVIVKSTKLDNVIPEKDGEGNTNKKPEGYKEVTFVVKTGDQTKGSIDGVAKFYVNPTEYVTITPPTTKAETGFKFGAWDKDATIPTVYDKDTTITGSFNGLKDVIPKTKDDESEKPAGYVAVTFELEKLDGKEAGKIVDGETITYFVKPNTDVTIHQPKVLANTGYEFKNWNPDTSKEAQYSKDTTVKGNFKKLDDIIPSKKDDGTPNAKPEGYVTVTFDKGANGKTIEGQTVYYVNPKADPAKTLGDSLIKKPTVKAEVGYKFTSWNFADTKAIQSNITVTAQYESIDDVIPKTNQQGGENKIPEGYITVTFEKGANGELEGNTIFYVNPNKAVVLGDKAPTIKPNTGYTSAGWDTTINKAIQYKNGDKITALYNELGNVIPKTKDDGTENTKPADYFTVTFVKGDHGELDGKTVYYVKPNKKVTVPAPTVTPAVGYEFEKWDSELTQTFTKDTTITAGYKALENIIPQKNTDGSDKPNGYVTVTFKADANGTLLGTTVYYVKPNVDVDLTDTAKAITKNPNTGYTAEGGTWNPAIAKQQYKADAEYEFNFVKLDDVIEKIDENTKKPKGYVTVKLIPTDKATDKTEKVYFVNPLKEVTITNKPEGKKETINGIEYTYVFNGWTVTKGTVASWADENIKSQFTQETEITAQYSKKLDAEKLVPAPVAKKNVVTPKGDTPKPEDLIENKTGLPEGTTFKYTNDGTPDVNNPGKTTAKVEVKYPNGKTVVVDVPITVVDNVVPQTGTDKPLVPESYVKVIVDTTDKATDNTYFVKTFWVNPNVEVKLPGIFAPNGKTDQEVEITGLGKKKVNYVFKEWQKVQTGEKDDSLTKVNPAVKIDLAKNKFTDKVTVIEASYNERFAATPIVKPIKTDELHTPEGKKITDKDLIEKITPPANKEIESITVVERPDPSKPGKQEAKVTIKYKDGSTQGTNDNPVIIPVEVHKNIIPEAPGGQKPKDALDNYVKVIFKAGEGGTVSGDLVYYVSPEVEVDMTKSASKITKKPDVGYISGDWDTSETKKLKATFTAKETEFTFNFKKTDDIVEKTDDPNQVIPEGYVKVTLIPTDKANDATNKVYFVNPKAKNVTITNKPEGKKETINGIEYTYVFNGWTVTKGTVASWTNENINGQFTQDTEIVAKYKTTTEPKEIEQIPEVVSETPIVSLNQSDIETDWFKIKNKNEADSKIKTVEIIEKPATDSLGIQSGKAKVTFENGSSRIITIKLKVVDDVIETKDDKRTKDVPDNYKLVILDSTSDALEQNKRYFWINPDKDINLKAFKPQGKPGKVFDKWDRSLSINWNKEGITEEVLTIKAIYKDDNTPGGTTPGDKPGDKPGDNPGGTTPGDKPGDEPGDNPGGTTPGDKPGDKPGDNPGGTTPGGTTPGTNPETPGENPETPGTVPENPGAIPGTKPGVVEKHGNRYVERVAGKNRSHTAISTSKRFFNKSKYVIIADSGNYPDALTATVLAHVLDCPILLNNTRYLEDDVAQEIVRLGASEVIIVGGHKSISENVKSQLAKYDANKVQRIWGRDRYVTSSELAYEIERLTGKVNKAIIASGENFPDALATAPLGSKEIAPILLVTRNQMDKKVSKALKDLNIKRVYVAGGQNSVSKKLEAQLPQVIRRFSGQDRYETAILVASYTYPESKEVFVASGETFPDALVIGPVCARRKAPILLSKSTPVKVTDDYIEKSKIEYLYIIGGTNTIYAETAHKYAIED